MAKERGCVPCVVVGLLHWALEAREVAFEGEEGLAHFAHSWDAPGSGLNVSGARTPVGLECSSVAFHPKHFFDPFKVVGGVEIHARVPVHDNWRKQVFAFDEAVEVGIVQAFGEVPTVLGEPQASQRDGQEGTACAYPPPCSPSQWESIAGAHRTGGTVGTSLPCRG